jgi:hypothetical protein
MQKQMQQESKKEDVIYLVVEAIGTPEEKLLPRDKDKSEERKKTYRMIGNNFDTCPIRGDGHCMFQAFAVCLLRACSSEEIREKIQPILDQGVDGGLSADTIQDIYNSLDALKTQNPIEILSNENFSNSWVALLRHITAQTLYAHACKIQKKSDSDSKNDPIYQMLVSDVAEEMEKEGTKIVDLNTVSLEQIRSHLDSLEGKTKKIVMGGLSEIATLSSFFDKNIAIIEFDMAQTNETVSGKGITTQTMSTGYFTDLVDADAFKEYPVIFIRIGDHFHAGFHK